LLKEIDSLDRPCDLLIVSTDVTSGAARRDALAAFGEQARVAAGIRSTQGSDLVIDELDRFNEVFGPDRYVVEIAGTTLLVRGPTLLEGARARGWPITSRSRGRSGSSS